MTDLEMPSCHSQASRKARQRHICCECLGFIQAGEKYNFLSGVWDGKPRTYKTCMDCHELRLELYGSDEYELGGLFNFAYEAWDTGALFKLAMICEKRGNLRDAKNLLESAIESEQ